MKKHVKIEYQVYRPHSYPFWNIEEFKPVADCMNFKKAKRIAKRYGVRSSICRNYMAYDEEEKGIFSKDRDGYIWDGKRFKKIAKNRLCQTVWWM